MSPGRLVEQAVGLLRAEAEAEQALRASVRGSSRGARTTISSAHRPPTFSRSSTMMRSAVRLPMPGTAWKRAVSPEAIAFRSSRGVPPESTASATFGPHALDADQHQEQLALGLGREAAEVHAVVAQHRWVRRRHLPAGRGTDLSVSVETASR